MEFLTNGTNNLEHFVLWFLAWCSINMLSYSKWGSLWSRFCITKLWFPPRRAGAGQELYLFLLHSMWYCNYTEFVGIMIWLNKGCDWHSCWVEEFLFVFIGFTFSILIFLGCGSFIWKCRFLEFCTASNQMCIWLIWT